MVAMYGRKSEKLVKTEISNALHYLIYFFGVRLLFAFRNCLLEPDYGHEDDRNVTNVAPLKLTASNICALRAMLHGLKGAAEEVEVEEEEET